MSNANVNPKVGRLARMALLVAIIILLTFTPLGYITLPFIAATTIQMPVIIGAVMMGPVSGLVLGLAFGLSALCKVLMMPGADPDPERQLLPVRLHRHRAPGAYGLAQRSAVRGAE